MQTYTSGETADTVGAGCYARAPPLLRVSAYPRFVHQPPEAEPVSRRCELVSHLICYMLHGVARVYKYSLATCPVVDVEGYVDNHKVP